MSQSVWFLTLEAAWIESGEAESPCPEALTSMAGLVGRVEKIRKMVIWALFVAIFSMPLGAADPAVVIVVHPKSVYVGNQDEGELTAQGIKDIYLGTRRFWGGARVMPVHQKNENIFREFLKNNIGMAPATYLDYRITKAFAEALVPIMVLGSSAEVMRFVSEEPAAIGYMYENEVDDKLVRVIRYARQASGYQIIVNIKNAVQSLTKAEVSRMFLGKVTEWTKGQPVLPVDLPRDSGVRALFSKDVHGRSSSEVDAYWETATRADGIRRPTVRAYESYVVTYVKENPGAIGYVSSALDVRDVKVIALSD